MNASLKSVLAAATLLSALVAKAVPDTEWVQPYYLDINALLGNGSLQDGKPPNNFFYKFEVDGYKEEGHSDLFSSAVSDDGLSVLMTWSPLGSFDVNDIYLKSSSRTKEYLYWDTTEVNWSAYSGFYVSNEVIRNAQGNLQEVSNVSINGAPIISVPEGGETMALLGLGALGLGFAYRTRNNRRA